MRIFCITAAIVAVLMAGAGCQRGKDKASKSDEENGVLEIRAARLSESLARADSGDAEGEPIARWLLPPDLSEISGLALTPDGRLFAHNDEAARITEIDYRRGTVTKQFFVGEQDLKGDFEGLAYAKDRFFLLSSKGTLFEFPEGGDGDRVGYTARDTGLGKQCEFEGVAYDPAADAIVLACKNVDVKQFKDMLVLFRYSLPGGEITELTVPYDEAIGENDWKLLRPTDITVDPSSGNYVLVAAQEKALVELTPAGDVVFSRPLGKRHPQSEAIAITPDHILIIGDESNKTAGAITLYRWP